MDEDKQNGFQGNDLGTSRHSLISSTGVTYAKISEPHPENEVGQDSNNNNNNNHQTHPSGQSHCEKQRPLRTEITEKGSSDLVEASVPNVDCHKSKEPHRDEEAGLEGNPSLNTEAHYDRGWAWVVCGTTFLMEFFVGGLITSSGVIYAALVDEFNKSRAETGNRTRYQGFLLLLIAEKNTSFIAQFRCTLIHMQRFFFLLRTLSYIY